MLSTQGSAFVQGGEAGDDHLPQGLRAQRVGECKQVLDECRSRV